ncbi:MAG TPA: RluA family pseudouridine synthase, partial [Bdellovibrionota bacterium]|nr:RluA family pseudouridine synthase [Bdellovibrionota bacterium]
MGQIQECGEKVAYRSFVGHNAIALELAEYMAKRFTYFSVEAWTRNIENGEVSLNGAPASPKHVLKLGDEVQYMTKTRAEPLVPKKIDIVYQDQDIIVVNKPAHIPVHPTGRFLRNTMIHVLKKQLGLDFLVLAHRLDRETTGLCVLSKTPLGKDKMYWQFYNNEVDKTYWALAWGEPAKKSGIIDAPIGSAHGPDSRSKSPIRIKQEVRGAKSKTAKTKYHTLSTQWIERPEWNPPHWPALERLKNGEWNAPWPVSLIECKPVTGRTNQIRVHLGELGTGILGDKLYDPDEQVFMQIKG